MHGRVKSVKNRCFSYAYYPSHVGRYCNRAKLHWYQALVTRQKHIKAMTLITFCSDRCVADFPLQQHTKTALLLDLVLLVNLHTHDSTHFIYSLGSCVMFFYERMQCGRKSREVFAKNQRSDQRSFWSKNATAGSDLLRSACSYCACLTRRKNPECRPELFLKPSWRYRTACQQSVIGL